MTARKTIVGIFALAIVLRLAALLVTFHGNDNVTYYDDSKIALNLVAGRGFSIDFNYRNWLFYEVFMKHEQLQNPVVEGVKPTASKQPIYPLVIAFLFLLFGAKNFLAVFLFQAAISAGTAVLVYLALRRVSPLAGLIGGLGMALYPSFVVHSVMTPESTTLLLFCVALFWVCILRLLETVSIQRWVIVGALGALMALTEPVALPFVGLSLLYAAYLTWSPAARRGLVLSALVFALAVAPWLARNYFVFDRFPVMKSVVGVVFNWGLERSGQGSWISDKRLAELEYEGRERSELEEDEAIRRELRGLFASHWKEYILINVPMNVKHFWWEVARYSDNESTAFLLGRRVPYVLILVLSLPALLPPLRRILFRRVTPLSEAESRIQALALILMATFTIVYSIFGAYMSRYRFPVELALLALATHTMTRIAALVVERFPAYFPMSHFASQKIGR